MKITRTAKELRSQSPSHHHQTWRTLRNAILCAELYEALRGGEKVVTVTESAERGETHDVYKVEITVEDAPKPVKAKPEFLAQALNSGDGVYRP